MGSGGGGQIEGRCGDVLAAEIPSPSLIKTEIDVRGQPAGSLRGDFPGDFRCGPEAELKVFHISASRGHDLADHGKWGAELERGLKQIGARQNWIEFKFAPR